MSDVTVQSHQVTGPLLQLHLEPDGPIEVGELTGSLGAIARQYQSFVERDGVLGKSSDARLLVWSVAPGSIDIAFLPDLKAAAGVLASAIDPVKHTVEFAEQLKKLLKLFSRNMDKTKTAAELGITIKDCEDAINFTAPITNHGGTQTITVIKGDVVVPILTMSAQQGREIADHAQHTKLALLGAQSEVRQRVPLIWKRLDRGKARTESRGSPDRALVPEIDKNDRPTFFTDETAYLKEEMIGEDENPWQRVYFVDVEVSRVEGKVVGYRVIGYHGKEDLD